MGNELKIYVVFKDLSEQNIEVQESSSVTPTVWIRSHGNKSLCLNVEQAKLMRDALDQFISENNE
jgi:hypothetical protein